MVKFFIEKNDKNKAVYKYYPEDDRKKTGGIISVDLKTGDMTVDVPAEMDFKCTAAADELNELRNAINEMRKERGAAPLTDDGLPTANKEREWYFYADHVIRRLKEEAETGNIPEKGTVAWY